MTQWRYTLAEGISPDVLDPESVPEMSVDAMNPGLSLPEPTTPGLSLSEPKNISSDISGTENEPPTAGLHVTVRV